MRDHIVIPDHLRPEDGRFGSGPSKVRPEGMDKLFSAAPQLLGTSHRQGPVRDIVRRVREGLAAFFSLDEGYEVALGNGGATLFWDAAAHCLISERSAHAVFGEFSAKFAAVTEAAPWLTDPVIVSSVPGTHPVVHPDPSVDLYALTHCETSTGVAMPISRPSPEGIVAVDATSGAGGLVFAPSDCDAYYFSPQKSFGSEGGLWIALFSPAAVDRIGQIAATGRHIPAMLDLRLALENSRLNQTYNTPAIATLLLMAEQIDWLNARGGLGWAAGDCAAKAAHIYHWAETREWAAPFVEDPAQRSNVVCTVDLDHAIPAERVTGILRGSGIVDTEAYRKLGRNQLRVAVFPAVDLSDVERLTASIDYVVDALSSGIDAG